MSIYLVTFVVLAMSGLLAQHINNESQLTKRLVRSGSQIKQLLDARELQHIDLEQAFQRYPLFKQIRILEYYMHVLDANYDQYMHKHSIFKRVEILEQSLKTLYPKLALQML